MILEGDSECDVDSGIPVLCSCLYSKTGVYSGIHYFLISAQKRFKQKYEKYQFFI